MEEVRPDNQQDFLSLEDIERTTEARTEQWLWPAFEKTVVLRSLSAHQIQQVQAEMYRRCEFKQRGGGGEDSEGSMNIADLDSLGATILAIKYSLVQPTYNDKWNLALRNSQRPEALEEIWEEMNRFNNGLLEAKGFKKKVEAEKKD